MPDNLPDPEALGWADIGAQSDFPEGEGRGLTVEGQRIAVFRGPNDAFCAVGDHCPHAGAPLSAGTLRDGRIVCSWHGFCFEPASGACSSVPSMPPLPVHAVRVRAGRVEVGTRPTG